MSDPLNKIGKAMQYSVVTQEGKTAKAMSSTLSKTYQQFVQDTKVLLHELSLNPEDVSAAWKLARVKSMGEQIAKAADRFAKLAKGQIDQDAAKAAEKALKDAEKALKTLASKGVHVDTKFNKVPVEAVQQMMAITRDNEALAQLFSQFGPEAQMQATDVLLRGVAIGRAPALLAKDLQAVLGTTLSRALLISRTEILRSYRNATHVYYKENEDVVRGWIWHSHLGPRTCASCLAMHGTVHSLDETLDDHPAGRCVPLPWVKTATELGVPGSDFQQIYQDGEKWLENQPVKQQIEVLGKKAWQAWQAKQVDLSDFVQTTYSPTWGTSRGKCSLVKALEHHDTGVNIHAGVHLTKFLEMEISSQEALVKQALKLELEALAGHDIEKLGKITGVNKKPGWFGPGIKKADKVEQLVAETHPDDLKLLVSSYKKIAAQTAAETQATITPTVAAVTTAAEDIAAYDKLQDAMDVAFAVYGGESAEYKQAEQAFMNAWNQFQVKHGKAPNVWKMDNLGAPVTQTATIIPSAQAKTIDEAYAELETLTKEQLHAAINATSQFVPSSWTKYDMIQEVKAFPDDVVAQVYEKAFGKTLTGAKVSEIEAEIANVQALADKWHAIHDGTIPGTVTDIADVEDAWNKAKVNFEHKWGKSVGTAELEVKAGKSIDEIVEALDKAFTKPALKDLMQSHGMWVPSGETKSAMLKTIKLFAKHNPDYVGQMWEASGLGIKTKASMLLELGGMEAEAIKTGITNSGAYLGFGQEGWTKQKLLDELGFLGEADVEKVLAEASKAKKAAQAVQAAQHKAEAALADAKKLVKPGATIEQDAEALGKAKAKYLSLGDASTEYDELADLYNQGLADFQAKHGTTLLKYNKAKAETVVDPEARGRVLMFQKTGAAQGSNAGGFYTGHDGVKRYIKEYSDPTQAWAEHLSNDIYRSLGLQVPKSEVFVYQGKTYYASEIVEGATSITSSGLTLEQAQNFARGFVADVVTANWDAVGLSLDNILWQGGNIARIDNGGTLLFRARAGRKIESVLDEVQELDGLLDHFLNPSYAAVMQKAGVTKLEDLGERFIQQVAVLRQEVELRGGWAEWVQYTAPGLKAKDAERIVQMLDARTEKLVQRADELAARIGAKPVRATVARSGSAEEILAQDVDDALAAGAQGKALAIDTVDIEDQNVLLFQDVLPNGTRRTVMELKIRPDSDASIRQAVSRSLVSGGQPAGVPLDLDTYYGDILKAVKTVNTHAADGAYNTVTVDAARKHRTVLETIIRDPGPDAETKAMAQHYLSWLDKIDKAMADRDSIGGQFSQYLRQKAVSPASSGGGDFVATKSKPTFTHRAPDGKGGVKVVNDSATVSDLGIGYHDSGEQITISFHDGTRVRYRTWSDGTSYAHRGTMEVVLEGEPTVERVQQALANISKLGINAEAATAEDMELMYLKKMAYVRKEDESYEFGKALQAAEGKSKAEQVQILREYWNKQLKVADVTQLDGYNPFGEYEYGYRTGRKNAGQRMQMRFDISESDVKQHMGDRLFYMKDTTDGIDRVIEAVLQHNGAFVANMEKARVGVPLQGMSVSSDMESGGANYVFTRVKAKTERARGYYWKPDRLVRRMDAITYDHDTFGNVKDGYVRLSRYYRLQDIRTMPSHSANETIFKRSVSLLDHLDHIKTDGSSERASVIAKFHAAGIHRLPDGRAIEDVIK